MFPDNECLHDGFFPWLFSCRISYLHTPFNTSENGFYHEALSSLQGPHCSPSETVSADPYECLILMEERLILTGFFLTVVS